MMDIRLLLLWLQVASGLLQVGVLWGLYVYVYREEFLKYWLLANACGLTALTAVLVLFRFAPATPLQAHTMQLLVVPRLVLMAMAAVSLLRHPNKSLVAGLTLVFVAVQAVIGIADGDVLRLVADLRVERLAAAAGVALWLCAALWRKYPMARTLGGRVTILFLSLQAAHYLVEAVTAAGLPLYPATIPTLSGILGATLPLGTAAGLFLLALESGNYARRIVRESGSTAVSGGGRGPTHSF